MKPVIDRIFGAKVINRLYANVFITGYKNEEFGWLAAVPALDNAKMRPAGIIDLGANT
ncbi:DNA ligase-1 [Paenibacillus sp. cl141a]|uniref:hypothetical protein n=1 Tax=Paenibacillus sp. cl141a TaxID=1761877 RepID=UPI0008C17E33|nr:hypothetical protein [Paenibacillus sp. cl141a]SEM70124.1 DNA ligase-1 [Paenibacillus sp. cl141a]